MEMLGLKRFAVGQVILMKALSAMRMFLDENFFIERFPSIPSESSGFFTKG